MQFRSMYERPIDRSIDPVVKAGSTEHLASELEEFVFTPELRRNVQLFLDEYDEPRPTGNGAWISGFFGSGKSHLLKILAVALENREVEGRPALDYLLPKLEGDPLAGDLARAVELHPSQSILFNVDVEAPNDSRDKPGAMLDTFLKVFNRHCGYFDGAQPHIAQLEYDLDSQDVLPAFEARVAELCGKPWADLRAHALTRGAAVTRAYDEACGNPPGTTSNVLQYYRQTYAPTISSFARRVREYVDRQPKGFRLNFFVDEVGQFIAGHEGLMVNLQSIAEELNSACGGRAWVVVTSQEDMDATVGQLTDRSANDFSKIQDRFKVRMKLSSQDTQTIIQQRLLRKTPEAELELGALWQEHHGDFGVLFDFQDGSKRYLAYEGEWEFVATYPFVPYQFDLLTTAIRGLSDHNAFSGRHSSTGARSTLGVFQDVAKRQMTATTEEAALAPFDLMFEGLRQTVRAEVYGQISIAENQLRDDPMALRVLKALFLVRYCDDFRATPANLRVLLFGSLTQNTAELEARISEALATLERQVYVRRRGATFEYLTNEEKDVEQEIRATPVADDEVDRAVGALFSDLVGAQGVTYRNGGFECSYRYELRVNGTTCGRVRSELVCDLVCDPESGQAQADALQPKTLCVVLAGGPDLMDAVRTHERTERYAQLRGTGGDARAAIIADKRKANAELYQRLRDELAEQLRAAACSVAGVPVEARGAGAKEAMASAALELVRLSYPALQQLGSRLTDQTAAEACLAPQGRMGGTLPEYAATVEAAARVLASKGTVTVGGDGPQSLAAHFARGEFGWPDVAVRNAVAVLVGADRVEVRLAGAPLEGARLADALRKYAGCDRLCVRVVQQYTPAQLAALRGAVRRVTGTPPAAADAKGLVAEARDHLAKQAQELASARPQAELPFAARYEELLRTLEDASRSMANDWRWGVDELPGRAEALGGALGELGDMRLWAEGQGRERWQELRDLCAGVAGELGALGLDSDEALGLVAAAEALVADPECYRSPDLPRTLRKVKALAEKVDDAKAALRAQAAFELEKRLAALRADPDFRDVGPGAWAEAEGVFAQAAHELARATSAYQIRSFVADFDRVRAPRVVAALRAAVPAPEPAVAPVPAAEAEPAAGSASAPAPAATRAAGAAIPTTPAPAPAPEPARVADVAVRACAQAVLDSPEDVEAYVGQLREALLAELACGRIVMR